MSKRRPQGVRNAMLGLLSFGLLLNFVIHPAVAGTPANKAVASGSTVRTTEANQTITLMSASMRTSAPQDLILNVNLECTILQSLVTNNDNQTATAKANIVVWVEFDGKTVPINDISSPGDHTPGVGSDIDKVTFCNRDYSRSVVDQEDPQDGVDQISDYINTKSAHSFQWLLLNAGSGIHSIVVKATLETSATESATSVAYVGNRTLIVEPTHLANNASI
jgi:hypothetical protein